MNRRTVIKALASAGVVIGSGLAPVLLAQDKPPLLAPPEVTSPLFHVFGTLPEPVEVKRIFTIGAAASVLVNSVAPKQLLGWPLELSATALPWLSQFSRQLPQRELQSSDLVSELLRLQPTIIVDVAPATAQRKAEAQAMHAQTGITYVLVEAGRLEDSPEQLRVLGAVLGHQRHGQQLAAAAQEVLDKVAAKRAAYQGTVPTVYMAHSETGLVTGGQSDVLRVLGVKDVAAALAANTPTTVSIEQLQQWDPELILTQNSAFYAEVYQNPLWQNLSAVRDKKVLFVPSVPFAWLENPPSINRLFGALWLGAWLYSDDQTALIDELRHLFILYYAYDPSVPRLQELLADPAAFAGS